MQDKLYYERWRCACKIHLFPFSQAALFFFFCTVLYILKISRVGAIKLDVEGWLLRWISNIRIKRSLAAGCTKPKSRLRSRRFDKNEQASESSEREGKADAVSRIPRGSPLARVHYSSTTTPIGSTKGAPCACVTPACVRSDSGSETRRKVEEEGREDLRFAESRSGKGGSVTSEPSVLCGERETGKTEIPRIVRRWKEVRCNVNEREGNNLRAMSLTHDEDMRPSAHVAPRFQTVK